MVSDGETVFRYMLANKIGIRKANLYADWALLLEKYRRNFEAASLVYLEGLRTVSSPAEETCLMQKYFEFASRMQLRFKRDIPDSLGRSLEQHQSPPGSQKSSRKRTYQEVFGTNDSPSVVCSGKKRLLECN